MFLFAIMKPEQPALAGDGGAEAAGQHKSKACTIKVAALWLRMLQELLCGSRSQRWHLVQSRLCRSVPINGQHAAVLLKRYTKIYASHHQHRLLLHRRRQEAWAMATRNLQGNLPHVMLQQDGVRSLPACRNRSFHEC